MDKQQVREERNSTPLIVRDRAMIRKVSHRTICIAVACSAMALIGGSGLVRAADQASANKNETFLTSVAPLLKTHCLRCHSGKEPKGELSLEHLRDAWNVQKDVELGQRIFEVLTNKEMPPEAEPQPPEDAVKTALRVLELEISRYDCTENKHPGRVTIRRLNRAEYNNTVRDLVGIDFRPADDFPSDDVGHGFDNIGDVLSIPPVL